MNIASESQSRPQGLLASRVPKRGSITQPRRPKFPTTRNFLVFPIELGQKRSPLDAFPFTSYTTIDLKTRYVLDPNLTQEVDEVWVDTASYYKQKQSPQHEFIIFSVTSTNGMRNFIALDRNVNVKGWASLVFRGGKSGPPAQDYFHISHYADIGSLINHCGNTASEELCTHVEQVAFEPKAFSFAQLVVLASTVSESCPSYQLGATNCYWFASLIWECMFNVFAEGVTRHKKNTEERGRFRGNRIQGAHGNFEEVVEKYKKDVAEFWGYLTDDSINVMNRRSRRMSALPSNPLNFEKDSNTPAASMESRRSRAISTATTLGASATNQSFSDSASQSIYTGQISALDGQSHAETQHDEGLKFGSRLITRQMFMEEILEELEKHGCENMTTQIDLVNLSEYPVARGGFSDVYRGLLYGRVEPVCLKALRYVTDHAGGGNKQSKLAAQELYTWSKIAQFRHPNVLEFLGMAVFRGQIAIISPWMAGGTLSRYLQGQPQVDRYPMCYQIASAVAYLHNEGVIHGDIRGDNILLSEDKQVLKLADFGNASPVGYQWDLQFSRSSRSIVTTFRWTAPEIMLDETATQGHTWKSDVYALGMTILETMTGRIPFHGLHGAAIYRKLLANQHPARPEDYLPLKNERADLLWLLLLECWDHNPGNRLSSHEVCHRLDFIITV